jgi:hypothetical protein
MRKRGRCAPSGGRGEEDGLEIAELSDEPDYLSAKCRGLDGSGSRRSSADEFARTRFLDGYRVELIERG